jgi:hypothetical protein
MMDTQNRRFLIKTATFACGHHSSSNHIFANSVLACEPDFLRLFVNAGPTTVDPFLRRRCSEHAAAMSTGDFDRSTQMHGFVVAATRTVFRCFRSARNHFELAAANRTVHSGADMFVVPMPIAFSRAKTGRLGSIFRVVEFGSAILAGLCHSFSLQRIPFNVSILGVKPCL